MGLQSNVSPLLLVERERERRGKGHITFRRGMDTCIWNHDYLLPSVEAYFGRQNVGMQSVCPIAEFYLHVARVCGSVIELYETARYD